jgi:hypothetical protein
MTGEEIKIECEQIYDQIKQGENRLKELRSICGHEQTYEGTYSWRIGSFESATICSHCGEVIKIHRPDIILPNI